MKRPNCIYYYSQSLRLHPYSYNGEFHQNADESMGSPPPETRFGAQVPSLVRLVSPLLRVVELLSWCCLNRNKWFTNLQLEIAESTCVTSLWSRILRVRLLIISLSLLLFSDSPPTYLISNWFRIVSGNESFGSSCIHESSQVESGCPVCKSKHPNKGKSDLVVFIFFWRFFVVKSVCNNNVQLGETFISWSVS